MQDQDIREYFSRIGIQRITRLDEALLEAFGQEEGEKHIERLDELFGLSEDRLVYGTGGTVYLHRQEELVAYLNQSLRMSLLASSFYDRVFFKRAAEYLSEYDSFFTGDILDIGCGNGILTCFLARQHPDLPVMGLDLSREAVRVAGELAGELGLVNVHFKCADEKISQMQGMTDGRFHTLFSCRTFHENVAWRPLCEESAAAALTVEEQEQRHRQYAAALSALIKPQGYLISVERYEDDSAYAGLVRALEGQGFRQVKGTHTQFSCKCGDGTGIFQTGVFYQSPVENNVRDSS